MVEQPPAVPGLRFQVDQGALGRREAQVPVLLLVGRNVVEEQRVDAAAVQVAEVIELEEGVDHQLPVHARPDRHRAVHLPAFHVPGLEIGRERSQEGADVEFGTLPLFQRRRNNPDKTIFFRHGERAQAMPAAVEITEPGAVRDPKELSGEIVAPAVVGADEGALARAARLQFDTGRAVAADVEEGAQLSVGSPGDQDRLPGLVVGDEIARLAQLPREGDHDRVATEQQRDLALMPGRIEVLLNRGMAHARTVVARVGAHHLEHPLDIGHLVGVLHRLPPRQIAFMPPSITSSVPVTKRDSSEIR